MLCLDIGVSTTKCPWNYRKPLLAAKRTAWSHSSASRSWKVPVALLGHRGDAWWQNILSCFSLKKKTKKTHQPRNLCTCIAHFNITSFLFVSLWTTTAGLWEKQHTMGTPGAIPSLYRQKLKWSDCFGAAKTPEEILQTSEISQETRLFSLPASS